MPFAVFRFPRHCFSPPHDKGVFMSCTRIERMKIACSPRLGTVVFVASLVGCAHPSRSTNQGSQVPDLAAREQEVVDLRRENADLRERLARAQDQLALIKGGAQTHAETANQAKRDVRLPVVHLDAPAPSAKRVVASSLPPQGGYDPNQSTAPEYGHESLDLGQSQSDGEVATGDAESSASAKVRPQVRYVGGEGPVDDQKAAPPPGAPVKPDLHFPKEAKALYEGAWKFFRAEKMADADAMWAHLAQNFPQHELADNAWYWRGEIAYHEGRIDDALRFFLGVVEKYPAGNKVADAMLKQGFCYLRLGDMKRARFVLTRVSKTQAGTEVGAVAARKLREIE
jgi:tol-pal system protein YbgF